MLGYVIASGPRRFVDSFDRATTVLGLGVGNGNYLVSHEFPTTQGTYPHIESNNLRWAGLQATSSVPGTILVPRVAVPWFGLPQYAQIQFVSQPLGTFGTLFWLMVSGSLTLQDFRGYFVRWRPNYVELIRCYWNGAAIAEDIVDATIQVVANDVIRAEATPGAASNRVALYKNAVKLVDVVDASANRPVSGWPALCGFNMNNTVITDLNNFECGRL